MSASVTVRLPSGDRLELLPGDLIGRTAGAALVLDDPRVSEAHALLSLRGGELRLLSLRRMVAVDGTPTSSVVLREGLRVTLAEGLDLLIEALHLPSSLPALQRTNGARTLLSGSASIFAAPPRVVGRHEPTADAWLWSTDGVFRLRQGDAVRILGAGDRIRVGEGEWTLVDVPLEDAGHAPTRLDGAVSAPLHIVARFDSAHLHRDGRPPLVLSGRGARILSELVTFGGPVAWDVLAGEIWPDHPDPLVLRHRLDVNLGRLRSRLKAAGIRGDLVRSGGTGQVELVLYDGDTIEDAT